MKIVTVLPLNLDGPVSLKEIKQPGLQVENLNICPPHFLGLPSGCILILKEKEKLVGKLGRGGEGEGGGCYKV